MPLRVLIADDEPIERKVLQKIIGDSRLPAAIVGMARSGNEAVEAFERFMPDLVFMDIRMPGMDGLAASELMKNRRQDTTIALVTAYDDFQYAKRAIDIHIDYFLLKPVDPAEVVRVLRRTLGANATAEGCVSPVGLSPNRTQLSEKIAGLLHAHYAEAITLSWLESRLNVSSQYLSRTFKEAFNESIMGYLTQYRIRMAMLLLADPGLSVAVIAEQVGIPDASYFGQVFKSRQGVTPKEYRSALFTNRLQANKNVP